MEQREKEKTGLVLEGGAMRGLFTAGVLDVLYRAGIRFDGIIGVSAGAVFGCNYKSGQPGRVLRYNRRFCREWRYCSWRSWLLTGDLFGADFCYRKLPDELDIFDRESYRKDPADFYVVCTDVHTGRAEYVSLPEVDDDCFEWMRASASMPLVSRTVRVGGGEYLDGAVADSIPLRYFEALGFRRNVVILTQPAGFIKKPSRGMRLLRLFLRKYPALLAALEKRHEVYNEEVAYVEKQAAAGKVLLIRPEKTLPIGRLCHSPECLQETYDIGVRTGQRLLPEIRQWMHSVHVSSTSPKK